MPQGLFDKPKDKTPWIDPRFKQDQESTTPRLDQAISAIGGFMGLPQEGNIGSPNTNASQYGQLASAAIPVIGGAAAIAGPFMRGSKQITQLGRMNQIPMGKGISPSMLPPDLIPMGAEAAFNAPKITQPAEMAINYGARTNPSIGGRIDVVKMMNDLGNSRNAAKLQRGEVSTPRTNLLSNEKKNFDISELEPALNRTRPEKPDFAKRVLDAVGPGKPGLSEQANKHAIPWMESKSISYRNPDGHPIASVKLIKGSDGDWAIEDFAADKTKGLLYGKAVKKVGEELLKQGIKLESAGSATPDALNLINKAKAKYGK